MCEEWEAVALRSPEVIRYQSFEGDICCCKPAQWGFVDSEAWIEVVW
jgi:hypothetical protein